MVLADVVMCVVMCVVVGVGLALYGLHAICDPYWSKGTRRVGWVGLLVGVATIILAAVLLV